MRRMICENDVPLAGDPIVDPLDTDAVENDPRFPTGRWTGFFLQCWVPGRHSMSIDLRFDSGALQGRGADRVGSFTFGGEYNPADGKCRWTKRYVGRHSINYSGVNEGHGIWGVWELPQLGGLFTDRGVFHIWPEGMAPAEEANATVQAYLKHFRTRGLMKFAGALAVCIGLGFFFALALHLLVHFWGGGVPE